MPQKSIIPMRKPIWRWSVWHMRIFLAGLILILVTIIAWLVSRGVSFDISSILSAPWWSGAGVLFGFLLALASFIPQLRRRDSQAVPALPSLNPDTPEASSVPPSEQQPKRIVPVVLPQVPPNFVDREEMVADLVEVLTTQTDIHVNAIQGIGGIGKSAVAARVVSDPRIRFTFSDGVSWHSCDGMIDSEGLSRLLDEIMLRFGSGHNPEHLTPQAKEIVATGNLVGKRVLLVLDNVEEGFPLDRALKILVAIADSGV